MPDPSKTWPTLLNEILLQVNHRLDADTILAIVENALIEMRRWRRVAVSATAGECLPPDHPGGSQRLAIPIQFDGQPLGQIELDGLPAEAYSPEDRAGLHALADLAGLALKNAHSSAALQAQAIEQQAAETALREHEQKLARLLDVLPVGVSILDANHKLVFKNPALERILDLDRAGLERGAYSSRAYLAADGGPMAPADFASARAAASGGAVYGIETGVVKEDGRTVWASVSAVPVDFPDWKTVVVTTDVTARKQAELLAQAEQRKLEALIENTDGSIWSVDREYRLILGNRLYHQNTSAVLGRQFLNGECVLSPEFPPAVLNEWRGYYDRALQGEHFSVEVQTRFAAPAHYVEYRFNPILDAADAVAGVTVYGRNISERRQAEADLRQSEARYMAMFSKLALPATLARLPEGRYADVNEAFERTYGFTRQEAIGRTSQELGLIRPAERQELLDKLLVSGSLREDERPVFTKSGEARIAASTASIVELGGKKYAIVTIRDVTDERRGEAERTRLAERLDLATRSAGIGIWDWDIRKDELIWDEKMYCLYGLEPGQFGGAYQAWLQGLHPDDRAASDEIGAQARRGESEYDTEFRVLWPDGSVHWLKAGGLVFHDESGAAVRAVGVNYDITGRKQAEGALRESEARFRALFESSNVIMLLVEPVSGRIVDANPAAANFYGYSHAQLVSMNIVDINQLPPAQVAEERRRAQSEERNYFIFPHRLANGTIRTVEVRSNPITSDGNTLLFSLIYDITESVLNQQKLRESQFRTEMALRGANAGTWEWNVQTGETVFNERWAEIVGCTLQELEPVSIQTWIDCCHPDDLKLSDELLRKHFAGITETYECEARMRHKDGSWVWVIDRGKVMEWDADGKPLRMFGTHLDVTQRKRAEEALRQSQADLTEAQHTAKLGSWRYDAGADTLIWSEEMYCIYETNPDAFDSRFDAFISRIHPDDRERVAAVERRAIQNGAPFEINFRIIPASGEKTVRGIGRPLRDSDGRITGLIGTDQDVTEQKRREMLVLAQRDLARAMGSFSTLEAGFRVCLETVLELTGLDSGGIYLFDPEDHSLKLIYHQGLGEAFIQQVTHFPAGALSIQMILPGNSVYFSSDHPSMQNQHYRVEGLRSLAVVPILYQGGVIGCLNLASHKLAHIPEYTREVLETLAVEIGNFAVYLRSQQALHASEEKYRSLVEATDSLVALMDSQGRIIYANDKAAQSQGLQATFVVGKTLKEVLPASIANRYTRWIADVLASNQGVVHETSIGSTWYRTSLVPVRDATGKATMILLNAADITALKVAQQELLVLNQSLEQRVHERTAEVQDLYDNAPTGYHSLDDKGWIVMVNQTELNWLQYSREQMLGLPVQEILTETSQRIFRENYPRFKQSGRLNDLELEFVRQDGSTFPALVNATAIYDAAGNYLMSRATISDITERKKADAALRESELQNRLLFDESPATVMLFSEAGQLLRVNHAAENLMGLPAEQIIGHTLDELGLLSAEKIAALAAIPLQDFDANQNYSTQEFRLQRQDGKPVDVAVRAFSLQLHNQQCYLVSMHDITISKKAAETLSFANRELERAMRLKDEFLASMSHELRTPLTGILGLSEVLQIGTYGALNEKQTKAVVSIEASGRHLLELINDILDLSKIGAGMLKLQIESRSLNDICEASLHLVKGMAHKKRQQTSYTITPSAITIEADSRRLKQMLVNLLSNAIKFTPESGNIGLEVTASEAEQVVRLTVWDTGTGIAPENLPRLFQPFVQLGASVDGQIPGTGLGLAMVRRLAELHGGSVSVISEPGQGSRFTISLPWQPDAATAEKTTSDESESVYQLPAQSATVQSGVILLAEDTETTVLAIGSFLEALGYKMIHAMNGREALEKAAESRPDIILMDIRMPEMDGLTAIRKLRANPDFAATPIIALTALTMLGDRERFLDAGATNYLSKPVDLRKLADLIHKLLEAK